MIANLLSWAMFLGWLACGAWLGYWLSSFPRLDIFKLLTILGISYQLLGIAVLSETVSTSVRIKKFVVHWFAGFLIWAHLLIPFGVGMSAAALFICELGGFIEPGSFPSARSLAPSAMSFALYSILPGLFVEHYVTAPMYEEHKKLENRSRSLGAFLVFTGTGVQLIAAIHEFLR